MDPQVLVGEKIAKLSTNFGKDGTSRKNEKYKVKKLAKLTTLWGEFEKNDNAVKLAGSNDAEYDNYYDAIKQLYVKLKKNLEDLNPPASTSGSDEDDDSELEIRRQHIRFRSLEKVLIEIEGKFDNNVLMSTAYCKTKLKAVEDIWARIVSAHENILGDPDDFEEYYEKFENMQGNVEYVLLRLQETLETGQSIQGVYANQRNDGLQLKRVAIPKFYGDYFKWITFRDLFVGMVKDNTSYTNAQKLQILKTNIGGEAEGLIQDLTISDANFEDAWTRLLQRYDDNRTIIYQLVSKLMSQGVTKYESKSLKILLDTTQQILLTLKNLGRPADQWDDWIVCVISQKLHDETRKDWERTIRNFADLPTWEDLRIFMQDQFRMLENVESNNRKQQFGTTKYVKSYQVAIDNNGCPVCKQDHSIWKCEQFKTIAVQKRWNIVKKEKLCFKCLSSEHDKAGCDRNQPCKKCKKDHSTWLHEERSKSRKAQVNCATKGEKADESTSNITKLVNVNVSTIDNENEKLKTMTVAHSNQDEQVLLATAVISTEDKFGRRVLLRALIDSGSQGSMMTEKASALLQLKPVSMNTRINPLGGGSSLEAKSLTITIRPHFNDNYKVSVECYILRKLTRTMPDQDLDTEKWNHIKGLQWADPRFYKVGPIDLLLGTEVVADIIRSGLVKGPIGQPIAQQTTLGWIISGKIDATYKKYVNCLATVIEDTSLEKFWELEELNPARIMTTDELRCEELYNTTFSRDATGQFTVKIPFKDDDLGPTRLGNSKAQTMARFTQLEKKLAKNSELKNEYVKVMNEYISLGHMIEVTDKPDSEKLYYIPHHAVIKPDSLTTKTRVVFDASAKTSTGVSLNDCMFTGSKQQDDLFNVLVRWRKHTIVFKSDIEKIYRQILLHSDDQSYHTVIWRDNPADKIREFQMTRVTFGTGAAPFLATRSMKQTATENKIQYPRVSQIIEEDFYVDDLISGTDDLKSAIELKEQLINVLQTGCFSLRKWTSNSPEFLKTLPTEATEKALQLFSEDESSKALGLQWNPNKDVFGFQVSWAVNEGKLTKRLLLSEASKIFDPLGWLAPVVINAKLMMQEVWLSKIDWDEEITQEIQQQWIRFRDELPRLSEINIKRWINWEQGDKITLHGFGDASEKAYAAAVYTRIEKQDKVIINLIASKTRVAPRATKTTLPRLELCGAVLVGRLLNRVQDALKIGDIDKFAWSDSMITLGWLNSDPGRWKTFVANRVAEVQDEKINEWNYVKSEDNPADCASRGIMPSELKRHELWWTGPSWLKNEPSTWDKVPVKEPELEKSKLKSIMVNSATVEKNYIERFSSWQRLIRAISYCKRWKNKNKGPLNNEEIDETAQKIIKDCQAESFRKELKKLTKKNPIKRTSNLLSLNPFLDKNGIMRVGGRLTKSELPEETKHPIILPAKHHVTQLIIREMHQETCHGGPQLMTTLLRKQFWIIQCKRMVNNEYKKCVVCKRQAGRVAAQIMGDLPRERTVLERAFLHTGVDYTGAVEIKTSRLRNAPIEKGYIALFICFATRAIHLELVSDQSSDAFLAAMQRFIARRGLVSDMYSDNGTNFVGAANAIERQLIAAQNAVVAEHMVAKGIKWHFIPPESATFGGLWERNIKSMKGHLKAVLGNTRLTFEEYGTVLCQIEACLNSRPLCPLTDDPDNINVLTPGHFLIGDALLAMPQRQLLDNNANKVNRWRYLQLLQQHFWKRWSNEYLNQLQQRRKWQEVEANIKPGDLVLIKDDDLPPRKWSMGRITETHPGDDGLVRVASIRTQTGITKRGIKKICPLMQVDATEPTEVQQAETSQKTTKKTTKSKYDIPNTRKLRPRPLRTGLWISLIAIFFIIGGGLCSSIGQKSPISITKFKHQPGIYFEDLGRAGVIKTEWHMFLYFDLAGYWHEFKKLESLAGELKELCHQDKDNVDIHCDEITNQLVQRLRQLKNLNELLKSNGENRKKRGAPLGFVGWIQHELFGVMDEEHANMIQSNIKKLITDENHVNELIRNQTSIADLTIELMKTTEEEINRNYGKITDAVEELKTAAGTQRKKEGLISGTVYIQILLDRFEKVQHQLMNAVTDLHQGHVNSHLFTPELFHSQLSTVYKNLPAGCTIPESPQDDLKSLYKLLRGKARVTEKMIVIDMILPLTSVAEYQMYRCIAIPTQHGDHRMAIVPNSKYLMITLEKDNFYQMDDNEHDTCLKTRTRSICWMMHPSYNIQSNRSKCERELLARQQEYSQFCQFQVSPEVDAWIQLQQRNRWIYSLRNELTLNVICDKKVFTKNVQGIGVLEIEPGCEIVQPEMTITAEAHKQSEGKYDFSPTLNLSSTAMKTDFQVLNLTIDHTQQLENIHAQLQKVRDQTTVEHYHHMSHYSINTGIVVLIIGAAAITWVMRKKMRRIYDTAMMTTGHVSEAIWHQWRRQSQRFSGARRPTRPANNSDVSGPVGIEPLRSPRGEHVQSGHNEENNINTI